MLIDPEDIQKNEPNYPRSEDVTYLMTLASRFESEEGRGKPQGFIIIVQEGDGNHTHHISDPDNDLEYMSLIGNMEVTKAAIIATKLSWEPVHPDGSSLTVEELEEFERALEDDDDEEGDEG